MKRDNMNNAINISSDNAKELQVTAPNLLITAKMHFHVCLIFVIYREKTNTMLSTNCFSDLLYKVKWAEGEKKTSFRTSSFPLAFTSGCPLRLAGCWPTHRKWSVDSLFPHICHYAIIPTASFFPYWTNSREIWSKYVWEQDSEVKNLYKRIQF